MKRLLIILSFLFSFVIYAQNNTALFEKGNALYNQGKYNDALTEYTKIHNTGEHSAALYFNMANAHYKLNHIAPSIFYYEKALLLSPNDKDIKNNLAFAKNMTIDAIDSVPKMGISKLFNSIITKISFDGWAKLAVLFSILFASLFVVYYFTVLTNKKRFAFIGSGFSLGLMLICLVFAYKSQSISNTNKPAIVFAKESNIKSEPNFGSTSIFKLHEGTKVQVLENINNWKKIQLADGKEGWILSDDLKMLKNS